jgi:hypothetical protein
MTRKRGPAFNEEYLKEGSPTTASVYQANMRRTEVNSAAVVIGATGIMTSVAIPLQAGDLVTNITFRSGSTAANGPTHWFFALYSSAATPALLAQTADQTSTAWAASTTKTLALTTPQLISSPGIYYASLLMTSSSAQITCSGALLPHLDFSTGIMTTEKVLCQSHGSAITTTAPATIASGTSLIGVPYVVVT